jgi:hypothetical protein
MLIEMNEENKGAIEIYQDVPEDFKKFVLPTTNPTYFKGVELAGLLQEFKGDGFSAWWSRFWLGGAAIANVRGDIATLELRIAIKNSIHGKWDKIDNAELPPHYFQMGFVPHILTRAIFEAGKEYQSFDIHFHLKFLQDLGIDYKTLDRFMNQVSRNHPVELSKQPHPCPGMMIRSVRDILNNSYSLEGKANLLQNNVQNILISALEQVGKEELGKLILSPADKEALIHVKELIEKHCPIYLGNDVLVAKAHPKLNAFKLSYGFKQLFNINPYDYYLLLRLNKGQELLKAGESVTSVANELEYESATTFIRAFKKRFGSTPKQYQLNED